MLPWQPASITAFDGSITTAKSPRRISSRTAAIKVRPLRSASTSSAS